MNGDTRIERQLPQILTDLGAGSTPDYTDSLLARTAATRQRPGWVFPERWLPMSAISQRMAVAPRPSWRVVVAAALLVLALVSAALYAGSQQRRLPAPFGPAENGVIPFVSNGDLFVGDPITGKTRLLVAGPDGDALPLFSPNGTRLAFIRDVGTTEIKPIDIYVAGEDGANPTKINPEPIWNSLGLLWTPDSNSVAVLVKADAATNRLDLYDATTSGAPETIVSAPLLDLFEFRPPDGREIMFRARVDGHDGLFAIGADGSNMRPILLANDPAGNDFWGGATWSADGQRVFYTRPYEVPTETGSCCVLWVVNADGSDPHLFAGDDGTGWDGQPTVSPDGTNVAFWHSGRQVAVKRADGTGPVIPTGPELPATAHFLWAPDSSKILMWSDDDASTNAYLLDPAGGPWTEVAWESDPDIDWQRLAAD